MIPYDVIERVREAADVVQIIGDYVNLKRTGSDYRGPCPFHQGKDRNFSVSPGKGVYYCFVCHESGNVFQFLEKHLGVEKGEAIRMVAQKVGIEVREDAQEQGPDPRAPFWEINAAAAEYFQRILWDDRRGKSARDYLASRDIPIELARELGIGYAPTETGLVRDHLTTLGFDMARMVEAGLMVNRDDGTESRPRFRDRVMFPILDPSGRHVGFGGRVLGASEPKYLNTPESPVFSKRRLLYGLSWAKNEIRREDRVLFVEGYFDVVRLMAAGLRIAVAPMGTALTDEQALLVHKYSKNAILLYDNDRGGRAATFRSGDELLRQGFAVRVVTLPEGEDPDTFVRKEGVAGLEREVAASIDIFERKIQMLQRVGAFDELHKKRRALDRLLPTIRSASDPVMREFYVARASEVLGVDGTILQREAGPFGRHGARKVRSSTGAGEPDSGQTATATPSRGGRDSAPPPVGNSAERELLRAMLHERGRVTEIGERIGQENFRDLRYRRIFDRLLRADDHTPLPQIAEGLPETDLAVVEHLLSEPGAQVDPQRTVEDSLMTIRIRDLKDEMKQMQAMIPLAGSEEKDDLIKLRLKVRDEINLLTQARSEGGLR